MLVVSRDHVPKQFSATPGSVIFFSSKTSLIIGEEGGLCQSLAVTAWMEKVESTIDRLFSRIKTQVDAFSEGSGSPGAIAWVPARGPVPRKVKSENGCRAHQSRVSPM